MTDDTTKKLANSKLLIIDDTPANLILLKRMLQLSGIKDIFMLMDSRLALTTFIEYQPDLILLDLKMPYMDGFEVLNDFRKHFNTDDLPVIMITGHDEHEDRKKALELGAKDFIVKPFEYDDILSSVSKALNKASV